jgi:hypothetical protein
LTQRSQGDRWGVFLKIASVGTARYVLIRKVAITMKQFKRKHILSPGQYRYNPRVLMVFTHFMDAFSTYLCAGILYCFTGLMGILLKWKCLKLLGMDSLKARITI